MRKSASVTLVISLIFVLMMAMPSLAKMVVTTHDGQTFNLPVSQEQIKAIYFTRDEQPASTVTPTPAAPQGEKVFDNWNRNACKFTDKATFFLKHPTRVTTLTIWYSWQPGEYQVRYRLLHNNKVVFTGNLAKGSCDSRYKNWCEGTDVINRTLAKGEYSLLVANARVCQNAGSRGNGFVIVNGTVQPAPATPPVPPGNVSVKQGKWSTNWGDANLWFEGDRLVMAYSDNEHGKLIAKRIRPGVYQGRWAEDKADKRCGNTWDGRHYWGTVVVNFTSPTTFEAQWGYCQRARNQSLWKGHKVQ